MLPLIVRGIYHLVKEHEAAKSKQEMLSAWALAQQTCVFISLQLPGQSYAPPLQHLHANAAASAQGLRREPLAISKCTLTAAPNKRKEMRERKKSDRRQKDFIKQGFIAFICSVFPLFCRAFQFQILHKRDTCLKKFISI